MTNIHVDYNPDHAAMTFDETNGQPILAYRSTNTTGARVRGQLIPDGWVLSYQEELGSNGVDEYITGITELTAVDEAVAAAQRWLHSWIYGNVED